MLRLHDTATATLQELDLRDPGRVSMYVCGSTVYADPHIGHGRFALIWDIIRRYLTWSGLEVNFVSNVTDIDDKIIDRANTEGRSAADVARQYELKWWESMDRLGVGRPTSEPHATEYVDRMVELIGELIDRGKAYPAGDGVYFAVETVPDYGLLAHQPLDSLRAGARIEVDEERGKHSPVDFALWKFAKPGEPSWKSPWGDGRPGWHTECVVMALDLLGEDFDLHGGGLDLAFPHHENERAQAVAAGRRFSRRWAHSGMVVAEGGEKMSKSLGNVISLPDLLERYDPRAYRLLVLQAHYRSPLTVTATTLSAAAAGMERLDAMARRFPDARTGVAPDAAGLDRFRVRMDDDLGTVQATAELFDLVKRANTLADQGQPAAAQPLAAAVYEMCQAIGLEIGAESAALDEDASALAVARDEARARGDYAAADAIRAQLQADGWIVEDTPGGTVIRR
ncbi:MAG: cysteinyl-tRNA synthetase [Acidimicrobiaceae bacterium]|nr:cysteinyl-tRNA synthetase [Acidimicrobiaceae bacterium]